MKDWITNVITRELKALRREIESYPSDDDLVGDSRGDRKPAEISRCISPAISSTSSATCSAKNGYVRNRDAEFGSRDIPRAELLREIDNAIAAVELGMSKVREEDLAKPFPRRLAASARPPARFSRTFATHLAYHLGQVDYHRRMLTGEGKTVKAMALTELGGKAP